MADKPDDSKKNLDSWFIGGEQTPLEDPVTTPPVHDDPPPIVPDSVVEPKPTNWARYAVLTAALLAFGGAGAYHFYPQLIKQPEPAPIATEPTPTPAPPEPPAPVPVPEPVPAPEPLPNVEEPKPVIPTPPKPLPKPAPLKKDLVPPIEHNDPPPPSPAPTPTPPPVVVVPEPTPTPAPPPPQPSVRPRLNRPDTNTVVTPPRPPVYTGPPSGVINWSGRLEKNGTALIEGLPGVPVMIDLDTKEFAIAETPSPANGWKRLMVRSRRKVHSVVTVRWTVIQQ